MDFITMAAVVGILLSLYFLWRGSSRLPKIAIEPRMREFAAKAVHQARAEFSRELDSSLDSLEQVDEILETFHRRHQSSPIPERELSQIVLTWGGYVGSVIQTHVGGTWQVDSQTTGRDTYPLCHQGREALPVIWSLQRIRKGPKHNIARKVDDFVRSLAKLPGEA